MAIDHSECDHPRTSSARARCRRQAADGGERKRATPKEVDLNEAGGSGNAKASTPGWRADECHICGIERSEFQGTDAWTGLFVLVGPKCAWRVKRADDFAAMTARR